MLSTTTWMNSDLDRRSQNIACELGDVGNDYKEAAPQAGVAALCG